MKVRFTAVILALGCWITLEPSNVFGENATNHSIFAPFPFAITLNREVNLMRSLLVETNKAFDEKVWRSVKTDVAEPAVVSYELVSFIFYYPPGVSFAPSAAEMVNPDELMITNGIVSRSSTTNHIPANYVRVFDSHRNAVGAEVELVLSVVPRNRPVGTRSIRRTFKYVYRDGWKEE